MKNYIGRDTGISECVKLSFVGKEYFSLLFQFLKEHIENLFNLPDQYYL